MFKQILLLIFLAAGMSFAAGPVYELRTYTSGDGKLDALVARFKNDTERIFKKHHMEFDERYVWD